MPRTLGYLYLGALVLAAWAMLTLGAGDSLGQGDEGPHLNYIEPQCVREDETLVLDLMEWADFHLDHPVVGFKDDSPYIDVHAITGVLTWTPTNAHIGDHFVTVTIIDDLGRSSKQEIRIEVEGEPPFPPFPHFGYMPHFILTQDVRFLYRVPVYGRDPLWSMDRTELYNDHPELFVVDNQTGVIDFTPRNEHVGNWTVTFSLTGGGFLQQSAKMDITVVNRNDRPVLDLHHTRFVDEGQPVEISLGAPDPDMDPRLADPAKRVDPAEALMYRTSLPHPPSFERTGQMTWVPTDEDAKRGYVTVYFDVRDHTLHGDAARVTFHVKDVTFPPAIQIVGIVEGQKVDVGKKITLRGMARDADGKPMDDCPYRWYAGTTLIGDTQEITWRTEGRGTTPIKLVVVDREGNSWELVMNITLRNVTNGHLPVWHLIGDALPCIVVFTAVGLTTLLASLWLREKEVRKGPPYR